MLQNINNIKISVFLPYAVGCMVVFFMALSFVPVYANEVDLGIDSDGDGLTDYQEIHIYGTDPYKADTDGDGYPDGLEVLHGYSPLHAEPVKLCEVDSSGDGIVDCWKIRLGLNVKENDFDQDGYSDKQEILNGYDPRIAEPRKVSKLIKVDLPHQRLTYYFDNIELESFSISGGRWGYPTPKGDFKVLAKQDVKHYGGTGFNFYYPNTRWNLHFTTNYWRYYIHGAYWHNNFGKPMSSGCVNVAYPQMERLYTFAEVGTPIKIY